jgi:hypothetical protein
MFQIDPQFLLIVEFLLYSPDHVSFLMFLKINTKIKSFYSKFNIISPSILFLKRGLTNIITQRPIRRPTLAVIIKFPHNGIRSKYKTEKINSKNNF